MQGFSRPRLAVAAITASAASLGGLALAAPAHAVGNTINVDAAGSGPYKTIAQGLAAAGTGDTVAVAAGSYAGFSLSGKAGITVQGSGTVTVTSGITLSNDSNVTVDGLTISGVVGAAIAANNSSGLHITHNTITGSGAGSPFPEPVPPVTVPPTPTPPVGSGGTPAVELSGLVNSVFGSNTVSGNKYHGIFASGPGTSGLTISGNTVANNADVTGTTVPGARFAAGISVKAPNVTVSGNVLHDNQDSGLQFYGALTGSSANNGVAVDNVVYNNGDHGIDNLNVAGGTIVNNTVFHNYTAGINVEGTSTGFVVENNTSVNNAYTGSGARSRGEIRIGQSAAASVANGGATVDHNLVFDTLGNPLYNVDTRNGAGSAGSNLFYTSPAAFHGATGQGANDQSADPKFANSAGGDFHLTAGSGAIGIANAQVAHYSATDADGKTWATADAGAYGYLSGGSGGGGGGGGGTGTGPAVSRIQGNAVQGADRYGTGIALSQKQFPAAGSAPAVVIAVGDNYPDALAGVPLAKAKGAPLLLVPHAGPNVGVTAEILRVLKPGGTVYVLGGLGAVPAADVSALGLPATQITRIAGSDRFDTAIQIAHALGDPKKVVLATGYNFADALAAGPYAANVFAIDATHPAAILLTADAQMTPADTAYLANATAVATVGGPAVTAAATAKTPNVTKSFKGSDRYETAAMIAGTFTTEKTAGVAVSGASNKTQFADALTGAAYLASNGAPLVLTDNTSLPPFSMGALNGIANAIGVNGTVEIFGGPAAVSATAAQEVASAVSGHLV